VITGSRDLVNTTSRHEWNAALTLPLASGTSASGPMFRHVVSMGVARCDCVLYVVVRFRSYYVLLLQHLNL